MRNSQQGQDKEDEHWIVGVAILGGLEVLRGLL
jgi:hypothetical protein